MGYSLVLPTNSKFLRSRQSYTRETLLGVVWRDRLRQKALSRLRQVGWLVQLLVVIDDFQIKSRIKLNLWLRFKQKSLVKKVVLVMALGIFLVAGLASLVFLAPAVYYKLMPAEEVILTPLTPESVMGGSYHLGTQSKVLKEVKNYQPPYDPTLPDGSWLVIEQIGVRTPLLTTIDPKEALTKGVWMAPDYGRPGDKGKPIILAAHRFGYKWWWQNDYWKKNSFYKLPETKAGTVIKIIDNKRQWEYEIYKAEEAEEISDYNADLILYTCKFLNSPVRYIRYARLINPEIDSQKAN